jgi:hypothetical protein
MKASVHAVKPSAAGATRRWFLLALAALSMLAMRPVSGRTGQAQNEPERASGPEWLKQPPPPNMVGVALKTEDVVVGIVLDAGAREGDTVSGTVVPITNPNRDSSIAEGMVLVDPEGKPHSLKAGGLITFVAGATMTWKLLDKEGKVLGSKQVSLPNEPPPSVPPQDPVLCQSNRVIQVPGSFDGRAGNTLVRIGGQEANVLAESPRGAIVVAPNLGEQSGKIPIQIDDAGKTILLEGRAVRISMRAPKTMRPGQRGNLDVTVTGLDGLREVKTDRHVKVTIRNATPDVVALKDGLPNAIHMVNPARIRADGSYRYALPFTALRTGAFQLAGSVSQSLRGCEIACAPCSQSWRPFHTVCDDKGTVNCARGTKCAGTCRSHSGGDACGHWFCDCKWGACGCSQGQ